MISSTKIRPRNELLHVEQDEKDVVEEASPVEQIDNSTKLSFFERIFMNMCNLFDIFAHSRRIQMSTASIFVFVLSVSVGTITVTSNIEMVKSKQFAEDLVATNVISQFQFEISALVKGVESMDAVISLYSDCQELRDAWTNASQAMMKWDPSIYQYELQVSAVTGYNRSFVYPPFPEEIADFLYDFDNLNETSQGHYRETGDLERLKIASRQVYFNGPYLLPDGFHGLFAYYPIFRKAQSPSTDLGCNREPTDCGDACWDAENSEKYYATVGSLKNIDSLYDGSHAIYTVLNDNGFDYFVQIADLPPNDFNYEYRNEIIFATNDRSSLINPIAVEFEYYNIEWIILLSPKDGWMPRWYVTAILLAVLGSCTFSLFVGLWLIEGKKYKTLLGYMLPEHVIEHLKYTKDNFGFAEYYDNVTICFCDIVDYTVLCSTLSPVEVVGVLDEFYTCLDKLCLQHGIYKVETIGDSYMCVAGAPEKEEPVAAAQRMVALCLDIINTASHFETSALRRLNMSLKVRIGVHSGSVVAGVVGKSNPRYCLFGDTVNTAARMETSGESMRMHVSSATSSLLSSSSVLRPRGEMFVKGKGRMKTYFVDALSQEARAVVLNGTAAKDTFVHIKNAYVIDRKYMGASYLLNKRILDWDFDVKFMTDSNRLVSAVVLMFDMLGIIGLDVDSDVLANFLITVSRTYGENPFHNLRHAVLVTQYVFMFLRNCEPNRAEDSSLQQSSPSQLPQLSKFTLLVAAFCHDADHPGHTNAFEIKSQSYLSEKYQKKSVLENHHISVVKDIILGDPACNIIKNFTESQKKDFWAIFEGSVYGTDMAKHQDIVKDINRLASNEKILNLSNRNDQEYLCRALLHCADLSNPVRDFKVSQYWSEMISEELQNQVQKEIKLGLSPDPSMVRENLLQRVQSEKQFLLMFGKPLWDAFCCLYPSVQFLRVQLHENISCYEQLEKDIVDSKTMTVQRPQSIHTYHKTDPSTGFSEVLPDC